MRLFLKEAVQYFVCTEGRLVTSIRRAKSEVSDSDSRNVPHCSVLCVFVHLGMCSQDLSTV